MAKEGYLYDFTEEERRVIELRWRNYEAAVEVIADLHNLGALNLPLAVSGDRTGFLDPRPKGQTSPGPAK